MRVIAVRTVRTFVLEHSDDAWEMMLWLRVVRAAAWSSPADVKATFGHRVDFIAVKSRRSVVVFDIKNNRWRMIAAVHYLKSRPERGRVYVLRILSHREYDLNHWKREL